MEAILKISASENIIITLRRLIKAKYDAIQNQSERMYLYNHLSNIQIKTTYSHIGVIY